MKYVIIILFIGAVLFLQIGIFPNLKIFNVFPNIILLAIISLAILRDWKENLGWIIIAGLFLDFYGFYNIIGISVIALFLTSLFAGFLNQNLFKKENRFSLILVYLIASLFYELFLMVAFRALGAGFNLTLLEIVIKAIYSSILSLPIFYIVKWYVDKIKKIQS